MPISIDQVAPDIFVLHWKGIVTLEEIQESHDKTAEIVHSTGIKRYVHILVMSEVTSFPLEPFGLWEVVFRHPEVIAVLIVNGRVRLRHLITVLNALTRTVALEPVPTLDVALERAAALLKASCAQAATDREPHYQAARLKD